MKRLVCLLLAPLLLSACAKQKEPPQTVPSKEVTSVIEVVPTHAKCVYEASISAVLLYNNSVGNEWQTVYTCEGETISSGKRWTVPLDTTQTVTIDVTITEDDEWPDVGSGSLAVSLMDGFKTSTTITVTENKGSYKGNTAQWQISCAVTLVDKLA